MIGCTNISFSKFVPSRWDWHSTDALKILRPTVNEALPASSQQVIGQSEHDKFLADQWDLNFSII